MARSITIEMDIPAGRDGLRLDPALQERLQELLDRQDTEGRLNTRERREAKALTELADMLSLMKARARIAERRRSL